MYSLTHLYNNDFSKLAWNDSFVYPLESPEVSSFLNMIPDTESKSINKYPYFSKYTCYTHVHRHLNPTKVQNHILQEDRRKFRGNSKTYNDYANQ